MLEQTEQGLLEQFEQVFKNYHPDHTPDFPYPLFVEIFQIIDQNSNLCCALLSPNGDISFSVKIKKLFEHQYIHEWMVAHHSADFLPTYEYFSSFLVSGCSGLIESWLAHGKKGQDKISVIFRLVPHIRDAFAGQRPILAAIFQNVRINGWTDRIIGQSGGKHEIDGASGRADERAVKIFLIFLLK